MFSNEFINKHKKDVAYMVLHHKFPDSMPLKGKGCDSCCDTGYVIRASEDYYPPVGTYLNENNEYLVSCTDCYKKSVPEILEDAAKTFKERNKLYGNNYKLFGGALLDCFGGEVPLVKNEDDGNRMFLIVQCLGKLMRYCQNFKSGGHEDSAHDLSVYAAMLQELTKK